MKNLSVTDVAAIGLSWTGAASVAYISQDGVITLIALCAGYYLSKWIILKKED
tara:strand:- start:73 stop:231 length:159 start_codon:yes stop_codon:yes gene_type:complete